MASVSILLCLVLVTTSLLSGIFARFAVSKSASADVKYKKWGLTVTTGDNLSTSYTKDNALVVDSSSTLDVMAPGTKGSLMWFRVSGSAEVDFGVDFSGSIEIGSGFSPTSGITNEEKVFLLMKMIPEDVETQRLSVISSDDYRDNPVYSELEFPLEGIKEMAALALTGKTLVEGSDNLSTTMKKYREEHNESTYVTFDNKVLLPIYQDIQNGVYDGRVRSMVNELRVYDETGKQIEYFPIQFRYAAYDVSTVNGEEVYTKVESFTSGPIDMKRTDKAGNEHYFVEGIAESISELESFMASNIDMSLNKALDDPYKPKNTTMDRIYSVEWEWLYHYDTVEEVAAGKTVNNRESTASGNYQTPDLDTQLGEAIAKYPKLFEINLNMSVKLEQVNGISYRLINENGVRKVEFGSYPKTNVTTTMGETLNGLAGSTDSWTSYGYTTGNMCYTDVTLDNGEKYRGVYFTEVRNDEQAVNNYNTHSKYWFKYEPIVWTILDRNVESGEVLILSDMIIDSQPYQSGEVPSGLYKNNYEYSTIKTWLNETFYNTAFSELQKQVIITTEVVNDAESADLSDNTYVCANTNDNVFLLSVAECKNYFKLSSNRFKVPTDYAFSQGSWKATESFTPKFPQYWGNGYWWLRSPSAGGNEYAAVVMHSGVISEDKVLFTEDGVVPALWIRL